MNIAQNVAEVLDKRVTLELESLDRVYRNVYQPKLQTPKAVFCFLREYYGPGASSSRCMWPVLFQVQFLFSLHGQALLQRARVPEAAIAERRPRLRGVGERDLAL